LYYAHVELGGRGGFPSLSFLLEDIDKKEIKIQDFILFSDIAKEKFQFGSV